MYAIEVRDRIMIAHSLPHPLFGPAQGLHGATFIVDVTFMRERLSAQNIVVDMGAALEMLKATLTPLAYQNLDAIPAYQNTLTTTEFLAADIHQRLVTRIHLGELGEDGKHLSRLRVTLHETDLARAWFEGPIFP
jgi:6-pyruvoyl-tetrahydropterin synthase